MTRRPGAPPSWTLARSFPARLSGLKGRLALIVALVLLVPTAFAVVQAMRVLKEDEQRQRATLERTLALIGGYHDQVALQATRLLLSLAARPAITGADLAACDEALKVETQQNALFLALNRADRDGNVVCSSWPNGRGMSYADRRWFQELAGGGIGITSSGVLIGRNPLTGPTMVVGTPILGPDGAFRGSLSVGLSLDALIALPRSVELPADAVAAVVDRDGVIATSRGDIDRVGLDRNAVRRLLTHPLVPESWKGQSGRTWQFLARPSNVPGMQTVVVAGLPIEHWGWLDARFQSGILLPTSILFLSVFVVWVATDILITRPLLKLARAVRQWRQEGEMPPLLLEGAPEELGELAQAFSRAATEIRERDQLLHASLQEKDLLLREIHHRVKNNLQIVTSLLNLRAGSLRNTQAQRAMREAQLSIKALALVHRKLYERPDLKQVSLDELLEELTSLVHDLSADLSPRVTLTLALEPVVVVSDQATPLALFCTELLTNAVKHAFPADRDGMIEVRLERIAENRVRLTISDDGIGTEASKADRSPGSTGGMGLKLVQMFARQIGGELTSESDHAGTRTSLVFTPATA